MPKVFSWLRLGFRNLGRNRKRTAITSAGLGFGYFAVVFMVGWMDGLTAEMIENGTGLLTGQLQIHASKYRPERSLYETIGGRKGADVGRIVEAVEAEVGVTGVSTRVYASGLLSSGESTVAGMLMGIDVEREGRVSHLVASIEFGQVPRVGRNEVVVGFEMARQLEIDVGDELVLVVPAADGSMGNDVFQTSGIFRTGLAEIDNSYGLVSIDVLQNLLSLPTNRIHEVAVTTTEPWIAVDLASHIAELTVLRGLDVKVVSWSELRPEMLDYTSLIESYYFILTGIVFGIAIFGVANTMLMATFERRREFAIMLALGTTPIQLIFTIVCEALSLGILSLFGGIAFTFPLMFWLHNAPLDLSLFYGEFTMLGALMRPVIRVEYNFQASMLAAIALLITALVAALYPAIQAARVPPADTLSEI